MKLLFLLAESRGALLSRQAIADHLWGNGVFVDAQHSVNTAINKLHTALRDDLANPKFIQTVNGMGYRFVAEVKSAEPIEPGQTTFVLNISCLYPVYVRGEAYLTTGQGSAAAAEFQKIRDHSGMVWNCWTGALAPQGVARAAALEWRNSQAADAAAARAQAFAAYKDFLTAWKDADPDIPVLKKPKRSTGSFDSSRRWISWPHPAWPSPPAAWEPRRLARTAPTPASTLPAPAS